MPTLDHYATPLKLPMTIDQFSRLPRMNAYKAELHEGNCELTYRPAQRMARLAIAPRGARSVEGVSVARIEVRTAQEPLAKLFAAAMAHVAPMDTMAATTRRHAADAEMKHVAHGGHGAVIESACLGAFQNTNRRLLGAAIVTEITLRPDEWPNDVMPASLPNLTWLFVAPEQQRRGVGTLLLDGVIAALAKRKSAWLVSHFSPDNVAGAFFHWRSGFELVPTPAKPYDGQKLLTKA